MLALLAQTKRVTVSLETQNAVRDQSAEADLAAGKLPLSVFAITLNEAANIARMLESVRGFAGEMLVVDCGSSDATVPIAQAIGAEVIHHPWQGYALQKQFALDRCKYDWCLCLDADEAVSEELSAAIGDLLKDESVAAYRLARTDVFAGEPAPAGLHRQGGTRLFRQSRCRFDTSRTVHEKMIIEGEERRVALTFIHFGYSSLNALTDKNNQYSSLKAEEKSARGKAPSLLRLIFSGPIKFMQMYFVQRNFVWGWRGFVRSAATAYYAFSVDAKRFEIKALEKQQKGEDK